MSEFKSPDKLPAKVQKVLDLYDDMVAKQRVFKNVQRANPPSVPPWKQRQLNEVEAQRYSAYFAAQTVFSATFKKLNKRDTEIAINVRLQGVK